MSTQTFSWPSTRLTPSLESNHVHVWAWDVDRAPLEADWEILSQEEIARARRFVFPHDRDRYVRAHSVLRSLLGGYTGVVPTQITFSALAHGKPQIARTQGAEHIHFNLTHSTGIAALAVSRTYQLGIDIEHIRPIDADVAEHHFSTCELQTLRSLPAEQWLQGFYRCWTSKEALLKGEGMGLNLPLDGFDVEAHPQRPAALLAIGADTHIASGWLLVELDPADSYMATLAIYDPAGTFQRTSLQCFSHSG